MHYYPNNIPRYSAILNETDVVKKNKGMVKEKIAFVNN
jgi:hypothetical protein